MEGLIIFAQDVTTTAVGTASTILEDRSDAMVILVAVLGILALWIWKVLIPQKASEQKLREADKEIHAQNASTLSKLTDVAKSIHTTTMHSNSTLRAFTEIKHKELCMLDKVSTAAGCDIKSDLSECRGILSAVRAGATSDE